MCPEEPQDAAGVERPLDEVEELVARCLETPEPRRAEVVDRLCTRHPEHAGELRARLEALGRALDELGASPRDHPRRLGEYRILGRLGEGGMGVVYEAEQTSLGRPVALKVVRADLLHFARARERFEREVQAVARLQHPGIVPIYAVGSEGGVPFFAMERIRGRTLAQVLKSVRGYAPERLSGRDLARAVGSGAP